MRNRKLNLNILNKKESKIVTTKEDLKDVIPIEWSEEVLDGIKKVIIGYMR